MFNREYRDMAFIPRWQIVRRIRQQYLAEHSYLVAMYANDICQFLRLDDSFTKRVLQHALWHDVEEVFIGDTPGPAKRMLLASEEAKRSWKERIALWMQEVFGFWDYRSGMPNEPGYDLVKLIVKAADWLEAACNMAEELQMGNANAVVHMEHCRDNAVEVVRLVAKAAGHTDGMAEALAGKFQDAVSDSMNGQSMGPMVDPAERAIAERMGLISRS